MIIPQPALPAGNDFDLHQTFGIRLDDPSLSRRLDWRFLMPSPDLENVAYFGDVKENLVFSLKEFSQSLTCFPADVIAHDQAGATQSFDIVVIKNPNKRRISSARAILKPGGYLYIEAFSWSYLAGAGWLHARQLVKFKKNFLPLPGFHTRCMEMLQGSGFLVENTCWHLPDFESCTRMIPLDDVNALQFALSSGAGIQSLLGGMITRKIVSLRAFANLVPCFSIVARREER